MRLFAFLLVLLVAGFGWAMWQGIDLATGRLEEVTAEGPGMLVTGEVELATAEQEPASLAAAPQPAPEQTEAARPESAVDSPAEPRGETVATLHIPSARSAKPPAGSVVAADEPAVTVEATAVTPAPGPAPIARRVTGDQVNLREGPDADTPSLGLLSLDDMVEVLDENGGWMRVRTEEGEEGWVAARFLAAVPD